MRVLVDVDGVCANIISGLDACARREGAPSVHEDMFPEFDFQHCTWPEGAGPLYAWMQRAGFCQELPWYPNAKEVIRRLLRAGHEVAFCTSMFADSPTWAYDRQVWCRRSFPDVSVIFCSKKTWIRGDILIDDALHNVRPWLLEGRKAYLIDRPWSRGRDIPTHDFATLEVS